MNVFPLRHRISVAFLSAALLVGFSGCSGSSPAPIVVTVAISGSSTTRLGTSTQFTATLTNSPNEGVVWQVDGITNGTLTEGTISGAGLYTAPTKMPAAGNTVTITAISRLAPGVSASLTETLLPASTTPVVGTAAEAGSSLSYVVDIVGSGFVAGSVIQAAGVAQETTYISDTQIRATVTVAPGLKRIPVTVVNPDGGVTDVLTVPVAVY